MKLFYSPGACSLAPANSSTERYRKIFILALKTTQPLYKPLAFCHLD